MLRRSVRRLVLRSSSRQLMYIPKLEHKQRTPSIINESRGYIGMSLGFLLCCAIGLASFGYDALQNATRPALDSDIIRRRKGKKILILGGGAAGSTVANIIVNQVPDSQVTVIEKNTKYTLTTMMALACVGHRSYDLRTNMMQTLEGNSKWLCPKVATFVKANISKIDPVKQNVTDDTGRVHDYDYLVVATGATADVSAVKGLREEHLNTKGLATYSGYSRDVLTTLYHGNCFVTRVTPEQQYRRSCDNSFLAVSTNVWKYLRYFGKLSPRHCTFKAFTGDESPSDALPEVYNNELWDLYNERKMEVRTGMQLVELIPNKHLAVFQDKETKAKFPLNYSYMFLDLPLKVPEPMASVFGANRHGFADVDHETLQHKKYPNVFALGDGAALPTIKSYGAVFTQAPVVCHNLVQSIDGLELTAKYDGYSSFPLQMSTWQWMWPEVSYGKKRENYHIWDNTLWHHIPGFLNGFVVQEAVYEMNFWFNSLAGQFHPQKWFSYPEFPRGDRIE